MRVSRRRLCSATTARHALHYLPQQPQGQSAQMPCVSRLPSTLDAGAQRRQPRQRHQRPSSGAPALTPPLSSRQPHGSDRLGCITFQSRRVSEEGFRHLPSLREGNSEMGASSLGRSFAETRVEVRSKASAERERERESSAVGEVSCCIACALPLERAAGYQ